MTQFAMDPIAKLGLLKMDFLGLTNLTILDRTIKMLKQTRNLDIELEQIPWDDDPTFQLLSSGKTNEVFQLESAGMQRNIRELKPSSLSDVAAMIALYRPGPMEQIPTFIDAKHGRSPVKSPHPSLDEILSDSYGVIVFQDQVLRLLQTFAGYSLGEADIVRKAMGKKIPELMRQEEQRFIQGAIGQGFSREQGQEVFNLIEPFAGYAFNKAHSVSYAQISYWTAYFKANYSLEYMASVLNSRRDHPDRMASAITECLRMEIPVFQPDVNRSRVEFAIDKNGDGEEGIRFGLSAIKNLGETAVEPLVQERISKGRFASLGDFVRRVDLRGINRRSLESLIRAGAFDCLGPRGPILNAAGSILSQSQMEARIRQTGQTSLFGAMDSQEEDPIATFDLSGDDADTYEKVAWEKELLGVALTSNPLRQMLSNVPSGIIASLDQLDTEMEGRNVAILGLLSSASERLTRDQRPFLNASLEMLGGALEVIAWPQALERTRSLWQEGSFLQVEGRVVVRGEDISVHCNNVREYDPTDPKPPPPSASKPRPPRAANNGHATPAPPARPAGTAARNGAARVRPPAKAAPSTHTNGAAIPSNGPASGGSRTLQLTMAESSNQEQDATLLQETVETMLEFPGEDRVLLNILSNSTQVRIDMPFAVKFCPELQSRLESLLGPESVSLELNPS